jgi:hypothetical protein
MGYEIVYTYQDRGGEGNQEEVKTMKKRLGDPYDDIPLEKLAGAIMGQFARRDIWVTNVEIYEYSKKKVSFKETKGGIIVKNKKFVVGDDASIIMQDLVEAPPAPTTPQHQPARQMVPATTAQQPAHMPHNNGQLRPQKWVIFQPSTMKPIREKGLRFTVDKKYPVFQEYMNHTGIGMVYKTLDDLGREIDVLDEYFVPADLNLFADKELKFSETGKEREGGKLLWSGMENDAQMPQLR